MSIFNDSFNHLSLDLAAHHKVEAEICTFVFRVCFDRFIKTRFWIVVSSTGHKTQLEFKLVNMGLFGQLLSVCDDFKGNECVC